MRWLALACAALLAGCAGPASQSEDACMALTKVLPLTTEIGNRDLGEAEIGWPNELIKSWLLATEHEENSEAEDVDGTRFVKPLLGVPEDGSPTVYEHDYRLSSDDFRVDPGALFTLHESAVYFRMLPMINDSHVSPFNGWYSSVGVFDTGDSEMDVFIEFRGAIGGVDNDVIDFRVFSFNGTQDDRYSYDPADFRWFRLSHSSGVITWESANAACSGWTTRMTYTMSGNDDVTSLVFYASWETEGNADNEANIGYIGPLNQVPNPRTLPLSVTIGDPKVITLTRTLPLSVEVGGS